MQAMDRYCKRTDELSRNSGVRYVKLLYHDVGSICIRQT